jgi:hypothetical protein
MNKKLNNTKKYLFLLALPFFAYLNGQAQNMIENFDYVDSLSNKGWVLINHSNPLGTQLNGAFQGDSNISAYNTTGFLAFDVNSADFSDSTAEINSWLLTPPLSIKNGSVLTFYTKKTDFMSQFPDNLEVRMSTNGSSADVGTTSSSLGDFINLLLSINPANVVGGYPGSWTKYTVIVSGLTAPTTGRFAFNYYFQNAFTQGLEIGIDAFEYHEFPLSISNLSTAFNDEVSIKNNLVDNNLQVVSKTKTQVDILDLSGRVLQRVNLQQGDNSISISSLSNGIYFLRTKNGSLKFSKQN